MLDQSEAEVDLRKAAREGDLATLKRLVKQGVNLEATDNVRAAPPAAATPLRPSPSGLAARRPCAAPPSPPPLTACGAAAAPPQNSWTAIMWAAGKDKLDCLDHLIAKGANLNAQNIVRRSPAATWRRGVWG